MLVPRGDIRDNGVCRLVVSSGHGTLLYPVRVDLELRY